MSVSLVKVTDLKEGKYSVSPANGVKLKTPLKVKIIGCSGGGVTFAITAKAGLGDNVTLETSDSRTEEKRVFFLITGKLAHVLPNIFGILPLRIIYEDLVNNHLKPMAQKNGIAIRNQTTPIEDFEKMQQFFNMKLPETEQPVSKVIGIATGQNKKILDALGITVDEFAHQFPLFSSTISFSGVNLKQDIELKGFTFNIGKYSIEGMPMYDKNTKTLNCSYSIRKPDDFTKPFNPSHISDEEKKLLIETMKYKTISYFIDGQPSTISGSTDSLEPDITPMTTRIARNPIGYDEAEHKLYMLIGIAAFSPPVIASEALSKTVSGALKLLQHLTTDDQQEQCFINPQELNQYLQQSFTPKHVTSHFELISTGDTTEAYRKAQDTVMRLYKQELRDEQVISNAMIDVIADTAKGMRKTS